jgi:benzodiazapine receptor
MEGWLGAKDARLVHHARLKAGRLATPVFHTLTASVSVNAVSTPSVIEKVPSQFGPLFTAIALAIGLPLAGGFFARRIRSSSYRNWKRALQKPPFRVSKKIMTIMQTAAYCSIGCSSFLVWHAAVTEQPFFENSKRTLALALYVSSVTLDILWQPLFCGWKGLLSALVDKTSALCITAVFIPLFYSASKPALLLALPYAAWQCYTVALSFSFWYNNHGSKRKSQWKMLSSE